MTERQLRKARHGNADAFTALCAPFEGMVYRHCLQMLKNPADAQDAAQETLLRAYRAFATFEGRSELATWLFRIAHNVCLDALKKTYHQREGASLDALREQGFDPPAEGEGPDGAYERASRQNALHEALSELPERQQALLSLRYGDGMEYAQIAKVMGLTLGTVKSALSRAKDHLRAVARQGSED